MTGCPNAIGGPDASAYVQPAEAEYDRRYAEHEASVRKGEQQGILARWKFGLDLLAEQGSRKQLSNGRLKQIAEANGIGEGEVSRRKLFASRCQTEEQVHHAVMNFGSWHSIVNEFLASTAHLSSEKDEWATPQDLFDALDAEFGFTLDVCATDYNAKCADFISERSLEEQWTGVCWMNPPYSEIEKWMAKAKQSAEEGATVACLVPARTDVDWWWQHAIHGEVRFIKGRLKFVDDEGNTGPAPFPSAVVVFGKSSSVVWWQYAA